MVSTRTIRINDIQTSITQAGVETRVAALASRYSPSLLRRFRSDASKVGEGASRDGQSSLAFQGTEQVATITLTSTDVKSYVIRHQQELGGWNIDDHFYGLTILHSPTDHEIEYVSTGGRRV